MATVGDIYEIRLFTQWDDQTAVNVRHYRVSAVVGTTVTDTMIAAAFGTAFGQVMGDMLSAAAEFRGASAQKIRPLPPSVAALSSSGAQVGDIIGDPLPRQVSGIVTLRTANAGRRYRGRFYMPFPAESANDADGFPNALYLQDLGDLATALASTRNVVNGGDSVELIPVVWSRVGNTFTDVAGATARPSWATQRRRGSYGRPNASPI